VIGRQNADIADTLHSSVGRCHGKHFFAFYICGAHWRYPANTTEPSVCGGDAALYQITLTTCLLFFFCKTAVGLSRFCPCSTKVTQFHLSLKADLPVVVDGH